MSQQFVNASTSQQIFGKQELRYPSDQNQNSTPDAESASQLQTRRVLPIQKTLCVIGCTHAGTLAAVQLRLLNPNYRIVVIERSQPCFNNAGVHLTLQKTCESLDHLFYSSRDFLEKQGIEVIKAEVKNVDYGNQLVNSVSFNQERIQMKYDDLVIASGSNPYVPPVIEGVDYSGDVVAQVRQFKRILLCKSLEDAQKLTKIHKPKQVCVLGGGMIGMEMAWALHVTGSDVTVIEAGDRILGTYYNREYMDVLQNYSKTIGLFLMLKTRVTKIWEQPDSVCVVCEQYSEGKVRVFQQVFDYVVISVGFVPNTKFLQQSDGPKTVNNILLTDAAARTSCNRVYAVGDCASTLNNVTKKPFYLPLATTAIRQGIQAAYNINHLNLNNIGCNGANAVQMFDYSVAAVGFQYDEAEKTWPTLNLMRLMFTDYLNHKYAMRMTDKVQIQPRYVRTGSKRAQIIKDEADLVVESTALELDEIAENVVSVAVVIDCDNNKLYGAQIIGRHDITQQINAFSVAMTHQMTADELAQMDYCGFDGEEKPWNVLGVATASAFIEIADFEVDNMDEACATLRSRLSKSGSSLGGNKK